MGEGGRRRREVDKMMIDPDARLVEVLSHAQEYLDRAVHAKEKYEREFYKRIVELYLSIAHELESLSDRVRSSKSGSN
jgi:hypothetical protein